MAGLHPNITNAANSRAALHAVTRRYNYQINIPHLPSFPRIIKQAIKIMHSVEDCEHLEVCDNGMVICSLHRGDVSTGGEKKQGVGIEISPATNGSEVKDIHLAYLRYKGKNPEANLEFAPLTKQKS